METFNLFCWYFLYSCFCYYKHMVLSCVYCLTVIFDNEKDTGEENKTIVWFKSRYIPFALFGNTSYIFNFLVWLRITDEGSVPKMRIWSISLI